MPDPQTYALLDSGHGQKLEAFGPWRLQRPCAQAVWSPVLPKREWDAAHAKFTRRDGYQWQMRTPLPESWEVRFDELRLQLKATDFGHLGVFPEQRDLWRWLTRTVSEAKRQRGQPVKVLNLFAYSGAATLAAARGGAEVCHLDAARGMVQWARDNAARNHLDKAPIRWLVDDAMGFLEREQRRQRRYDAIIMHPPSYGHGAKGEVFEIARDLPPMLEVCRALMSEQPLWLLVAAHSPEFSPLGMRHVLGQLFGDLGGEVGAGEISIRATPPALDIPSGVLGSWLAQGLPALPL